MTTDERALKMLKAIRSAKFHATWLGDIVLVLVLDVVQARYRRFGNNGRFPDGALSGRSSTWYSASGNAFARIDSASLWRKPLWLAAAVFCLLRSLLFSNRYARHRGLANMSAAELDVRSHILRRCLLFRKALECIDVAITKGDVSENSSFLLQMGMAECQYRTGDVAGARNTYDSLLAEKDLMTPDTRVRVLKSAGQWSYWEKDFRHAKIYLHDALQEAQVHGLGDQVLKIKLLQRRISRSR